MSEPVRIGVPLPSGAIRDTALLQLRSSSGDLLPFQVRPLDYWRDKSVKWGLLDFFPAVEANSQAVITLVNDVDQMSPKLDFSDTISISESEQGFVVNTGVAVFTLVR